MRNRTVQQADHMVSWWIPGQKARWIRAFNSDLQRRAERDWLLCACVRINTHQSIPSPTNLNGVQSVSQVITVSGYMTIQNGRLMFYWWERVMFMACYWVGFRLIFFSYHKITIYKLLTLKSSIDSNNFQKISRYLSRFFPHIFG